MGWNGRVDGMWRVSMTLPRVWEVFGNRKEESQEAGCSGRVGLLAMIM